jgi:hypothetical protein
MRVAATDVDRTPCIAKITIRHSTGIFASECMSEQDVMKAAVGLPYTSACFNVALAK